MKRSEMVETIAEALLKFYGGDASEQEQVRDFTKIQRLIIANIALKTTEEWGMLPPVRRVYVMETPDGLGKHSPATREWEPE